MCHVCSFHTLCSAEQQSYCLMLETSKWLIITCMARHISLVVILSLWSAEWALNCSLTGQSNDDAKAHLSCLNDGEAGVLLCCRSKIRDTEVLQQKHRACHNMRDYVLYKNFVKGELLQPCLKFTGTYITGLLKLSRAGSWDNGYVCHAGLLDLFCPSISRLSESYARLLKLLQRTEGMIDRGWPKAWASSYTVCWTRKAHWCFWTTGLLCSNIH